MMSQLLDDLLLPPDAASSNDNDTSVDYINDASFFKLFLPEFVIMQQKRRGCNQTWLMSCVCEKNIFKNLMGQKCKIMKYSRYF